MSGTMSSNSSTDLDAGKTVDYCGTLTKLGHLRKNWKQRWFVLQKRNLSYFATKDSVSPKGIIMLTPGTRVTPIGDLKNGFFLDSWPKSFHLVAESELEMKRWIRRLRNACQFTDRDVVYGKGDKSPSSLYAHSPEFSKRIHSCRMAAFDEVLLPPPSRRSVADFDEMGTPELLSRKESAQQSEPTLSPRTSLMLQMTDDNVDVKGGNQGKDALSVDCGEKELTGAILKIGVDSPDLDLLDPWTFEPLLDAVCGSDDLLYDGRTMECWMANDFEEECVKLINGREFLTLSGSCDGVQRAAEARHVLLSSAPSLPRPPLPSRHEETEAVAQYFGRKDRGLPLKFSDPLFTRFAQPDGLTRCGSNFICTVGYRRWCTERNEKHVRKEPDYDTIAAALNKSTPGTTIEVYPGVYEESITLSTPGVHLIGVCPADCADLGDFFEQIPLIRSSGDGSTVTCDTPLTSLARLRIHYVGADVEAAAIMQKRGVVVFEQLEICSTATALVARSASSFPIVRCCWFHSCLNGMLFTDGALGTVLQNTMEDISLVAITMKSNADPFVINNRVLRIGGNGIVSNGGGRGFLYNNLIRDCDGMGIRVTKGAECVAAENVLRDIGKIGIYVTSGGCGTIFGNSVSSFADSAVSIGNGSGKVSHNTLVVEKNIGILVRKEWKGEICNNCISMQPHGFGIVLPPEFDGADVKIAENIFPGGTADQMLAVLVPD